jgi:hypothetical protein
MCSNVSHIRALSSNAVNFAHSHCVHQRGEFCLLTAWPRPAGMDTRCTRAGSLPTISPWSTRLLCSSLEATLLCDTVRVSCLWEGGFVSGLPQRQQLCALNPAVCLASLCRHVTVLSFYLLFRLVLSWDDAFDWELRKRVCGSVRGACSLVTSGSPDTPSPHPPTQPPTQLFRYKSLRVALEGALTDLIARRVRGPSDDAASLHAQHSSPLLALIRELLAYDPSEL